MIVWHSPCESRTPPDSPFEAQLIRAGLCAFVLVNVF
jgi:hypothetical protein